MTRYILIVLAIGVLVSAGVALAAVPDATPTISQLQKKIRVQQNRIGDLKDEIEAQDAVISDQNDTITRLRTRIANQPDAIDVITAQSPDALWASMRAIWAVFPTLPEGQLCGYDKTMSPGDPLGLSLTIFQFQRWTGC